MRIRIGFMLIVATLGGPALAAPFTVAYEGNDFPENEGWLRLTTGGGAERSLEDGVLVLDGRARRSITDGYQTSPTTISVGANEYFYAEWRFSQEDLSSNGIGDATIAISAENGATAALCWSADSIHSIFEDRTVSFAFEGLTAFRLISPDLRTFDLFAGDVPIYSGQFRMLIPTTPRVAWGDGVQGAASLTRWDYVRFGVAPEPSGCVCMLVFTMTIRRSSCFESSVR